MIQFEGIAPEVVAELARGRYAREALELAKTKRSLETQAAASGMHRTEDGIGRAILSIPPLSYHYWGQRLGYGCWDDKQFVAEYWRDNPGARANSTTGKVMVGYRGENRRVVKRYASS